MGSPREPVREPIPVTRELIRERTLFIRALVAFAWFADSEIARVPLYRLAQHVRARGPLNERSPDIGTLDAAARAAGWVRLEFDSHRQGSTHWAYVRASAGASAGAGKRFS